MTMNRREMALLLAGAAGLRGQGKRSLAVEDFDFSTVRDVSAAIFGTQVDLGKGMSALMVKRIAQGGKFTVVERNKVGTVLKEQDFGASGRVKKGTQARIGQIRGADFTIMGDVVVFGRDDRRRSGAVGVVVPGAGGVGGLKNNEGKAVVVLNFRMVDNESSEIVMAGEARGESKRRRLRSSFAKKPVICGKHEKRMSLLMFRKTPPLLGRLLFFKADPRGFFWARHSFSISRSG